MKLTDIARSAAGFFGFRAESAAQRADWIDGAVRSAAQRAEASRLSDLRQAQRSFTAAETPAWTDSWPTTGQAINADLERQLPTLRARARGLARNNEWAIGYLIRLRDNVLGDAGIRFQVRLLRRDGSPDSAVNDRLEAAFVDWGADADVAGIPWSEVEQLALASLVTDGELLYRIRPGKGRGFPAPAGIGPISPAPVIWL